MDTTTSREEFEKWLEEIHGLYGEDIDWEPERNCYRIFGVHLAWCAWKESRASIVIDLPPKISEFNRMPDNGAILLEAVNYDEAIDDCAAALRSAGLTVKGD
ncbi:TPA: hypothetical protein ACPZUW_001922 [Yersinia enterocolitica]